jgi:hypothetical protein
MLSRDMTLREILSYDEYEGNTSIKGNIPQMPDSRPTAKQLESLLKETESTAVVLATSIGGRTFILAPLSSLMLTLKNASSARIQSRMDKQQCFAIADSQRPGVAISSLSEVQNSFRCRPIAELNQPDIQTKMAGQ